MHFPAGSILLYLNLTLRLYSMDRDFLFFYLTEQHKLIKWSYKEKVTYSIQHHYFIVPNILCRNLLKPILKKKKLSINWNANWNACFWHNYFGDVFWKEYIHAFQKFWTLQWGYVCICEIVFTACYLMQNSPPHCSYKCKV